jgi:hypothetical protein
MVIFVTSRIITKTIEFFLTQILVKTHFYFVTFFDATLKCGHSCEAQHRSKWARSRRSLHLHIENTGSQPLASAFFKLPNLVCGRSERPQSPTLCRVLGMTGRRCHQRS